ncbi:MAG TPA: hypothetical protein VFX44_11450 [Solirubrobacterales bacterium]|nr:hypothetical protein [Solirubrobacterales bacterium]
MGRRRLGIGLAIVVILVAAAGTAQAQAKLRRGGKFEVQPAYASGVVRLGKREGYRGYLFMATNGVAILELVRIDRRGEKGTVSLALYAVHTRGSVDETVRARFGSLGSFSLRFRPNGDVQDEGVRSGCEGPSTVTEHGWFDGHVTFHGEHHYLDFTLPGGTGQLERSFPLVCEKGKAFHLPTHRLQPYVVLSSFFPTDGNIALLYASARRHGRFTGIVAGHRNGAPPGAELRFESFESRGAMAIGRYALAETPQGALLTSLPGQHPATATLAPPAPFYGEARYRETSAHAGAWSGNLGIDLAGLRLPLTGPGFHARLCVLSPLGHRKGCDFFKAEPEYDERPARPWWMAR